MKVFIKMILACLILTPYLDALEVKPNIGYGVLLNDVGTLGVNETQKKGGANGAVNITKAINKDLNIGIEAGFVPIYNWKYSTVGGSNIELTYDSIPVLAVAEYKFDGNKTFTPYGIFECGIFITGLKTVSTVAGIRVETDSAKNYFGGAIGAGTIIKLKTFNLDLSAKCIFINDDI